MGTFPLQQTGLAKNVPHLAMRLGGAPHSALRHERYFSSGIKQILRALADQSDKEEADVAKKLFGKQSRKDKSMREKDEHGQSNTLALVRGEIERSNHRMPKEETVSPVQALRTRETWACMKGCGACCLLDKGPEYPPVEEVLKDPSEVALYKGMIGKDGWCKNFDKRSRQCTIYNERPRFCRVEPEIFEDLFGIPEHKLDKEACSLCRDSIKDVYGCKSKEMKNFERLIASLKH